MAKTKSLLSVLVGILFFCVAARAADVTVTGTVTTPNTSVPLRSGTLSFTLNQAAVVTGTAVLTTTPVTCATDTAGAIRGLPTPLTQVSATPNYASGSLPTASYVLAFSYWNLSGVTTVETAVGPQIGLSMAMTGKADVAAPTLQPAAASGYRVYLGTTTSNLKLQNTVTGWGAISITSNNTSGAAAPTTNNTVCKLTGNDSTIPQTTYRVAATTSGGAAVPGFPFNVYLTTGTVDVTTAWPLAGVQPRFALPIISNPASNATQSINSPITTNGYSVTQGTAIFPYNATPPTPQSGTGYIYENPSGTLNIVSDTVNISPTTLNNVYFCNTYVGANAGIKIAACLAAAQAAGGGVADARGIIGNHTIAQNIYAGVTRPTQLLLGCANITATTASWTPPSGSQIIGESAGESGYAGCTNISWSGTNYWIDTGASVIVHHILVSDLSLTVASTSAGGIRIGNTGTAFSNSLLRTYIQLENLYIVCSNATPSCGYGVSLTECLHCNITSVTVNNFINSGVFYNSGNSVFTSLRFQGFKFGPLWYNDQGGEQSVCVGCQFLGPTTAGTAGADYGYTVEIEAGYITFINALYETQPLSESQGYVHIKALGSHFTDIGGLFSKGVTPDVPIKLDDGYVQPTFMNTTVGTLESPINFGTVNVPALFLNVDNNLETLAAAGGITKSCIVGASAATTLKFRCSVIAVDSTTTTLTGTTTNLNSTTTAVASTTLSTSASTEVQVGKRFVATALPTLTDLSATPSIAAGNNFLVSNSGATNITGFTGGVTNQRALILCTNANTTFVNSGTFHMAGGINYACASSATIEFWTSNGSTFYEVDRKEH